MSDQDTIVIDTGSEITAIGFAGDDAPMGVFATVVGLPNKNASTVTGIATEVVIGERAEASRGTHTLIYPVREGSIVGWDELELVWDHAFTAQLRLGPDERADRSLLVSVEPGTSQEDQDRLKELALDTLGFRRVSLQPRPLLSDRAAGHIEEGDASTYAVWLGGSLLAVSPSFDEWQSRE
ncbi:hypothetical protein Sros01_03970 [Streptomyces roseochromogenus]|nr:hypothetical protein Sros01_03970 [Streptomyces roseochromogenus]